MDTGGQQRDSRERILEFIRAAKAQGMQDDFAVSLLRHNGWSERSIFQAYSAYYSETLRSPIPSRGAGIENARHAFFYLLAFITLGTWAFALGNLLYVLIDRALQDPLQASYMAEISNTNISFDMAAVIVAFPIFLWMTWIIQHEATQRPEVLDSSVRKWLTYLALVVTASALIGDAVMFLQQFLSGSLTESFILKSLVLIAIAGGIFLYYLGAVRADAPTVTRDRIFAGLAILAVCISIALGFAQHGSPSTQRATAFDQRRVEDLQKISSMLQSAWASHEKRALPDHLQGLFANNAPVTDPQTHQMYDYHIISGSRYLLCANFDTNNMAEPGADPWKHTGGRACFSRDASSPSEMP